MDGPFSGLMLRKQGSSTVYMVGIGRFRGCDFSDYIFCNGCVVALLVLLISFTSTEKIGGI